MDDTESVFTATLASSNLKFLLDSCASILSKFASKMLVCLFKRSASILVRLTYFVRSETMSIWLSTIFAKSILLLRFMNLVTRAICILSVSSCSCWMATFDVMIRSLASRPICFSRFSASVVSSLAIFWQRSDISWRRADILRSN